QRHEECDHRDHERRARPANPHSHPAHVLLLPAEERSAEPSAPIAAEPRLQLGRLRSAVGRATEERFDVAKMAFRLPKAARVIENPSADEVKALAADMPNARPTRYGNLNVQTDVLARSKRS